MPATQETHKMFEALEKRGFNPTIGDNGTVWALYPYDGLVFCSQDEASKPFYVKGTSRVTEPALVRSLQYVEDIYYAGIHQDVALREYRLQ